TCRKIYPVFKHSQINCHFKLLCFFPGKVWRKYSVRTHPLYTLISNTNRVCRISVHISIVSYLVTSSGSITRTNLSKADETQILRKFFLRENPCQTYSTKIVEQVGWSKPAASIAPACDIDNVFIIVI